MSRAISSGSQKSCVISTKILIGLKNIFDQFIIRKSRETYVNTLQIKIFTIYRSNIFFSLYYIYNILLIYVTINNLLFTYNTNFIDG